MSLRLLLNENVPAALVSALIDAGHDVSWVREASPGATDEDVLQAAAREFRICVTFDKDFGEPAAARALPSNGVILLRVPPPRTRDAARKLAAVFDERSDWRSCFSVIEPGRVRMRAPRAR